MLGSDAFIFLILIHMLTKEDAEYSLPYLAWTRSFLRKLASPLVRWWHGEFGELQSVKEIPCLNYLNHIHHNHKTRRLQFRTVSHIPLLRKRTVILLIFPAVNGSGGGGSLNAKRKVLYAWINVSSRLTEPSTGNNKNYYGKVHPEFWNHSHNWH